MGNYSKTTAQLLCLLRRGEKNAVSRKDLCAVMEMSDRSMRKAVSLARLEGLCICNTQNGDGYFLGDTVAELKKQYNQVESRGRHIFAQLNALRAEIDRLDPNQMRLDDIRANLI